MLNRRLICFLLLVATLNGSWRLPAQSPSPAVSALMSTGRAALAKGDHQAAAKSFRKLVAAQPNHLGGWHFLGLALHAGGKPEEALPAYLKAIKHPRLAATDSYNIACLHSLAGRTQPAIAWLEKAWRAGYRDLDHARKDSELANVRALPEFEVLLQRLQKELVPFTAEVEVLHEIQGEKAGDQFGRAAEGVFDGKTALLVVGAPKGGPRKTGRAYVYRGRDLKLAFTLDADASGAAFGEMFVSIPGDVNGDSIADIYVTDWRNQAKGANTGRAYVYSGKDGSKLATFTGNAGEGFGIGKAAAGDIDGDGAADLIIGAWQNSDAASSAGKAYLFSGKTKRHLKTYVCRAAGDTFGFDATGLGDVNGDGIPDLLITSAYSTIKGPQTGRVFVISGKQ